MKWPVILLGIVLISLFCGIRLADPTPLKSVRHGYFDTLQVAYPRDWQDLPVRVVDLDEASLATHGQWPWPRTLLADLTDQLGAYGVAVVAFDTLFAEPDRYSPNRLIEAQGMEALRDLPDIAGTLSGLDNDKTFAQSLSQMPSVLGLAAGETDGAKGAIYDKAGFVSLGNDPLGSVTRIRQTTPIVAALSAASGGLGSVNLSPLNTSDIVRRVPMVWQSADGPLPTLSIEALRLALGESTFIVRGVADVDRAMASIQFGGYTVPTTSTGELWVRFRKDDPRLYISAADVLAGDLDPTVQSQLQGSIVFVGTSAAGLLDIRTTALGERVPGVSVHAQILEQILTNDFLARSDTTAVIELTTYASIGLILATVMSLFGPLTSMLTGAVGAAAVVGASHSFFAQQGVLFDASFPILAGILTYGILTAYQFYVADQEKRKIRQSFSQYLAPSVLAEIERKGYKIELGGEMRPVTVMFTDIRNFTPLGERFAPHELVAFLNDLFTTLTDKILNRDGTVDKYIGDNVMAFWNAPLAIEGHEEAAAKAALDMRAALRAFCAERDDLGQTIELATGLAVGDVLVGNIGSRQRFSYSVLGDTVNVAARAETSCRAIGFDIVATAAVKDASPNLAWLYAGSLQLRGKSSTSQLYILVGDKTLAQSAAFARLLAAHSSLIQAIENGNDITDALRTCQELALPIDRNLIDFFGKAPGRFADFRAQKPSQIADNQNVIGEPPRGI